MLGPDSEVAQPAATALLQGHKVQLVEEHYVFQAGLSVAPLSVFGIRTYFNQMELGLEAEI